MRQLHKRQQISVGLGFNATPMVDVIFMLTIFFMLVSRFSEAELIPMRIPDPQSSRASALAAPERIIINCRPDEDGVAGDVLYSIGPNNPEPLSVIARRLAGFKAESPELKVVIRADRRLPYDAVRSAIRVVSATGIDMLNVAAHMDDGEQPR